MGKLLHYMYLVVKNVPKDVQNHQSVWELFNDVKLAEQFLTKAA